MSKPMLVTLPLVLLLLDYWPLQRWQLPGGQRRLAALLREKAPFFALALAEGLATLCSQHQAEATKTLAEVPLASRAANAAISCVRYLWQVVWPADLAVFYPFRPSWPTGLMLGAMVVLLGLCLCCLRAGRRRPWLAVGWLWYLITIGPVIGLIQVGAQSSADRYTYIPLIGIFLAAVWMAGELAVRARCPNLAGVLCVGLSALALWRGRLQVSYWQSSQTLFRQALAVTRPNALAHHCLGCAFLQQGKLDDAASEFRHALRVQPDHVDAAVGLGVVLEEQGQLVLAGDWFRAVLRRHPRCAEAHYRLADLLSRAGDSEQAMAHYFEAVRLKPDLSAAQNNLGNALQRRGRLAEAILHYRAALQATPDLAEARNNLGRALAAQGDTLAAIGEYQAALRLAPDYAEAHHNLGNALTARNQLDQAVAQYAAALRLHPRYPNAENSLGCALALQGKTDQAMAHFTKALELDPDHAEAHFNLGNALAGQGKLEAARQHLGLALKLRPDFTAAQRQLTRLSGPPTQETPAPAGTNAPPAR